MTKNIFFSIVLMAEIGAIGILSSCENRNTLAKPLAGEYAFNLLDSISFVSGTKMQIRADSLVIVARDSFTLYDPWFCEEASWWLAYDILKQYPSIETVYFEWEFNNDGNERSAQYFVHRKVGLTKLTSRYADETYYELLGNYLKEKKFRQYIIELYHLYGAVLTNDTTENFKHIYNENIFNVFSAYTASCGNHLVQAPHKKILDEVDKLAKQYGRGDGGYSSDIIHEVNAICDKRHLLDRSPLNIGQQASK